MARDFDQMLEKVRRQREQIDQTLGDSTASQHRTGEILEKLEELRRRASATQGVDASRNSE